MLRRLKERFEGAGEAEASQMESHQREHQDPELGLDPGEENERSEGHRIGPGTSFNNMGPGPPRT